jgi:hypothetical protein
MTGLALNLLIQLVIILLLLFIIPSLKSHYRFIGIAAATMVLFCIALYAIAQRTVRSPLTRLYIQLIMVAVFVKLLICLGLIIGYKRGFHPQDHTFVWPFLVIYIASTVYEVIFLEKVGRQKQNPNT